MFAPRLNGLFSILPRVVPCSVRTRAFSASVADMLKSTGGVNVQKVKTVNSTAYVGEAMNLMQRNKFGSLVVSDNGNAVGIITERDFIRKLDLMQNPTALCRDFMTPDPVFVTPQDSLETCIALMIKYGCRHLPVCVFQSDARTEKEVIGMVSIRDVVAQVYALLLQRKGDDTVAEITVSAVLENRKNGTTSRVFPVREDATAMSAARTMQENNTGCVVVMQSNQMTGIFTERDYLRLHAEKRNPSEVLVAKVMSVNPITVSPDYTLPQVAQLFVTKGFRHIPVMDYLGDADDNDSRPMDMLSIKDLVAACDSLRL